MPPKPPSSPSSSSALESDSSGATSDEEHQELVQATTPSPKKALPNSKVPVASDDFGSDEEEEEGDEDDEEDEEGSGQCDSPPKSAPKEGAAASAPKSPADESGSESESSDSDAKPSPPRCPSRGPDPSIKPISSKPMDGTPKGKKSSSDNPKPFAVVALASEKRKRQEEEDGEQGDTAANGPSAKRGKKIAQASRRHPATASPSKCRSGSAVAEHFAMGGKDAGGEAEPLYPRLREAINLLEEEDWSILRKGSLGSALELLEPAEAKALEDRWNNHFFAGFKYFVERAALKEELLKSLVNVLESQ